MPKLILLNTLHFKTKDLKLNAQIQEPQFGLHIS